MQWIVEHTTIKEEEYHVKVEFEDTRLWHETMTFVVAPSEEVSSLKVRVAKTIGHFASKLLLFRGSHQMGYSHNEKALFAKLQAKRNFNFLSLI